MEMSLMSDNVLLDSLKEGFRRERKEQVLFLKRLAEVDRRELWNRSANSLNEFCRKELGLSESSAWKRIQVCHLGVRLPYALELLERNQITLTNLSILSPCLTADNGKEILEEASGKGRYAVEAIKARFLPKPEPRDCITPISTTPPSPLPLPLDEAPSPTKATAQVPGAEAPSPGEPAKRESIRVRISFVADDSLVQSMNKVKSLLAHKYPNARLEQIEAEVYRFYLEAHDPERKKPKPPASPTAESRVVKHTRYTAVEVEKTIWRRDEGRCVYRYENGERCSSTYALEKDHIHPFSEGGRSDDISNRRLLCRFHNGLEAERKVGKQLMDKFRGKQRDASFLRKADRAVNPSP